MKQRVLPQVLSGTGHARSPHSVFSNGGTVMCSAEAMGVCGPVVLSREEGVELRDCTIREVDQL